MASTAVQRFYRYHAHVYDATRWLILHRRRRAVERLALAPDSRVLEVGCGTGLNFPYLLERLDPGRGRLVGLDFSADMLRRAARRVAAHGWSNVELVEGDAAAMHLPQRFDAVLFAYSLSMIPDWREALSRARAHLVPGGRLVVLDFGRFQAWGPLGPLLRGWLRLNHVDTLAGYESALKEMFPEVAVETWLGGYCFVAAAWREE